MNTPAAIPAPAPARTPLVALGKVFFRSRDVTLPAVLVLLTALGTARDPLAGPAADRVMTVLGIALALAGQALRAVVIGLVYIQRGGKNRRIHADTLVTDGFFAHCRNPLYVGNIAIQVGLLCVLHSFWGYVIGVPFVLLVYVAIVAAEEEFLRRQFGAAYHAYCRRVRRFVPRLTGLGETLRSTSFEWRRLVRKEYGATAAWMSMCGAILLWKTYRQGGFAARPDFVRGVVIAWGLVLVGYGVARALKKAGRLG